VPGYAPTYTSSIGSSGTGNGQFAHPAGVAVDTQGNLWVVDENNRRVEEFNSAGEYVTKFGSPGTGNGQFSRPTAIAISPQGNLWVADAVNCRLEEFNAKGEYLAKTGSCGTGNGQFGEAEGIAIDPKGNIWVADTYRARIQELNEKGEFIRAFGSAGSGNGQLCEPTSIAVGPGGNVWTTEWCNNRVSEFNESGEFIRKFGTSGSASGQFSHPDAVAVDSRGNVWVGDETNQRVQEFNQTGEYITQFGSAGAGNGQFSLSYPTGIAADSKGHLWVSDSGNNRVQKFSATDSIGGEVSPYYAPPAVKYTYSSGALTKMTLEDEASATDPTMSVSVNSGLATSVNAEAAGTATLAYEGTKLTSEKDPEGETKYEYDTSNRLKKVTLPNGTWASIAYGSYSRATAVTVYSGGVSKVTHFNYGSESRETIVWGGGNPEIIYSIGEDGSVFKWSYAEVPPTITNISGSLWGNRNSTTAVENKDQILYVHAESVREIASIKVVENGRAVLAEKTCEDNSEPPKGNCVQPEPLEWITNPSEHAAGELDLEVIATDFRGNSTAERFFVTMPPQPPPSPEAAPRPSVASIKQFRAAYGLDREHPLTEQEMNTLVLELLYEWELGEPTATTAVNEWGQPMRQPELAEMEYRREYVNRAAEVLPEWAEEHAASIYGGFYVDDAAGGIIYVGFTENQHALVESLKLDPRIVNPGAIREFPTPPSYPIRSLEEQTPGVWAAAGAEGVSGLITAIRVAEDSGQIVVGATNVLAVREALQRKLGPGAPIRVEAGAAFVPFVSRYSSSGPIVAGAGIGAGIHRCTAGYSARAGSGVQIGGQELLLYFVLTAGHCFSTETSVNRLSAPNEGYVIGKVKRNGLQANPAVDGAGILIDENWRSHSVLNGNPLEVQPIQGGEKPRRGIKVCWSGLITGNHCGFVKFHTELIVAGHRATVYVAGNQSGTGDSGGPVWDPATHRAVGIISGSSPEFAHCEKLSSEREVCDKMAFTPLRQGVGTPGIEASLGVDILKQG
jgi:YD repeat-containing protein